MGHTTTPLPAACTSSSCPSQPHPPPRHLAAHLAVARATSSLSPTQLCSPYRCPLLWPYALHCHASCSHMRHIATPYPAVQAMLLPPLVATCTTSPCLLQPHMLHRCTPPSCTCHITAPSYGCMHHVAVPHPAVRATSLPPLMAAHAALPSLPQP